MAHCTLSLRIAEQSLSGLSIALRATGGGEVPAQLNARLGILLEGCPEGRAGDHRIVGVDHDLHDLAAGAQFLDAEGVTFRGHQGLGFVAPQGFEHDAPLGAVELQLPALAGSIFLQAGGYLRLDRVDLGAYGRLALYGLLGRRFDVAFARLDLRPAQLTFLRHSQVRLIYRLDLIMVLPIAFRKLLNDLVDLGSRKSNAQSGQELNFLADSEFVRRHPSTRCANARRLLPLNHREHPDESIARRRTGRRAVSCTQARSDFLLGILRRLLGIPRRIASMAPTGTLPVPFGLEPAPWQGLTSNGTARPRLVLAQPGFAL